jgi:ABC-type uncharacterized transport system involved in gliding motility auxiliary subunit
MRRVSITHPGSPTKREDGSVRTILLVAVCFCLGLAVSAFWFRPPAKPAAPPKPTFELSNASKGLLEHLETPIAIRFYSLLDPKGPPALREFSGRVDQVLSAYEQQANGKILVTRYDAQTNANPNAALADGINGFNLDKGEGCYLGLALSCNGRKEVLAQLSPEWEPALESDVTRALLRLAEADLSAKTKVSTRPTDAAVVEEIKQRIPDIASVSLEDGTRTLRESSLKEFAAAVSEMQAQVRETQARFEQARNNGTAADKESALKHLQEVQTAQTEKLNQIAARSQAQITALQQLKSNAK